MADAKDKAPKAPKDGAQKGGGKPEPKAKGRPAQSEVAAAGKVKTAPKDYIARLKAQYEQDIVPALLKEFGYKNKLEVPRIEKIVLNMGVGEAVNDTKKVTSAANDLALIAGQKPVITRARKAISTFKVRENMPIGAKVTLAQDPHVRVSRPPRDDRAPARARLPRPRPQELRRTRQLRARREGAYHLPGDQLRQGRVHART